MCTYENERDVEVCAICLTPRRTTPTKSPGAAATPLATPRGSTSTTPTLHGSSERSTKKPRSSSSSSTTPASKRTIQQPLVAVGSSSEKEALRLKKKVEQLRELGIDLPANEMLALLARNCYSVMAAVSAYFEQLAQRDALPTAIDAAAERRVAATTQFITTSFVRAPFRLVGDCVMHAALNRTGVAMRVGDRLVLQAENAGKKRVRPTSSALDDSSASTAPVAVTHAAGIVRVANEHNALIGRLERANETLFTHLMLHGLVQLSGVCVSLPTSNQLFATFSLRVFVFVNARAFRVFDESHPLHRDLADPLYEALELLDSNRDREDSSTHGTGSLAVTATTGDKDTSNGLEALFADFVGASADDDDNANDDAIHPADQLVPLLSNITLRSHQRVALQWMVARENVSHKPTNDLNPMWETRPFVCPLSSSNTTDVYYINRFEKIASLHRPLPPLPCRGGILADDMGMGKTMMLLALIAYQKHFNVCDTNQKKQTLIVCPLSLLHQWKHEIDDRFIAQTLRVHVYYGSDDRDATNATTRRALAASDVVLTTYGILSKAYEQSIDRATGVKAPMQSPPLLLTTQWDRVILDEAHSIKNRLTTYFKACAALVATKRWCLTGTPLQNALDDLYALLRFLQYEPWSRLSWWHRVVAAPFEQGDVSALNRLKVVLTPILLRRTKHTRDRHGKRLVELPPKHVELVQLTFSSAERAFYDAVYAKSRIEFNGFVASGAARSSYVAIFALLLRLRQACDHPLLALGRDFEARDDDGDKGEKKKSAMTTTASLFNPQVGESTTTYYARIATQLQQGLQATPPPATMDSASATTAAGAASTTTTALIAAAGSASNTNGLTPSYIANVLAQVEDGLEATECPVCLDPPVDGVLTPCAHVLCAQCLRESLTIDPSCPVCRTPVDMARVFALPSNSSSSSKSDALNDSVVEVEATTPPPLQQPQQESDRSSVFLSAKLQQLLRDLVAIRLENKERAAASAATSTASSSLPLRKRKVVVFSQWTYMLDMVATLLQANGFSHCLFHGSMPQETRERVLTRFAKDPTVDVLVISLKAGGVGLNLTCASVVILLDPWWNPGVEDQAIDRVHRLGQAEDVLVKRYVVEDTVEDMILTLQARKAALAKHVLVAAKNGDDKRSEGLSLDDLKSFFR